jgi:hypothetical protein
LFGLESWEFHSELGYLALECIPLGHTVESNDRIEARDLFLKLALAAEEPVVRFDRRRRLSSRWWLR